MSERTIIGGTVYEVVGSSSSNLLLKCNGTARIQWGNKLIDLIKNGKIVSGDNSAAIYTISDESEIKSDGIYIINKDQSLQLWISKKGEQYNLTNTDLYISASTKQDLTVEQKQQALENIGMYYNTFAELQESQVQNGLGYVVDEKKLYTIKDGVITEFEAMLKTVTVEKEQQEGEIITSNVKIVLSVSDVDYLIVGSGQILVKYPIKVSDSATIESENANDTSGYRLYVDSQGSHLDVDYINVRSGLPMVDYIAFTYFEFNERIENAQLQAHQWYLIEDYKNPWHLLDDSDNRPILVRALTGSMLYPEGKLFKDQRVSIHYDPAYYEEITDASGTSVYTKGLITQMTDAHNNTANFDFLDYSQEGTTLHPALEGVGFDSSIFPQGSHDNTLTVNDLKGMIISEKAIGGTSVINFQLGENDSEKTIYMGNNTIVCNGLTLNSKESSFLNNNITLHTSNVSLPETSYASLYNDDTAKEVYYENGVLQIITKKDQTFFRGMIVMHYGSAPIPDGWAICDGKEVTYNGVTTKTPNLVGRFIKAVNSTALEGEGAIVYPNNELVLTTDYLPEHHHPHESHSHGFSGSTSITALKSFTQDKVVVKVSGGTEGKVVDDATSGSINVAISGTTGSAESTEKKWQYKSTPTAIKIEPNYYSLIFIIKL